MRKLNISLLAVYLCGSIISATQTRDVITERHPNGMKKTILVYQGEGRDEEVVERLEYYDNGQMQAFSELKNGIPNGKIKGWYRTGLIMSEGTTKNGELHGVMNHWAEKGHKHMEVSYIQGKKHGIEKNWYENGQIKAEANWEKGQIDGLSTLWSPEGMKIQTIEWKSDKEHGEWIEFYEDGGIKRNRLFAEGEYAGNEVRYKFNGEIGFSVETKDKVTTIKDFFDDGTLRSEVSILNNDSELLLPASARSFIDFDEMYTLATAKGEWIAEDKEFYRELFIDGLLKEELVGRTIFHYANGNPRVTAHYPSGAYHEWYDTGIKKVSGRYSNGKKDSIWTQYFHSGEIDFQETFEAGKTRVKHMSYYTNGIKREEGHFLNEKREGLWTFWTEKGIKKEDGNYTRGKKNGRWTSFWENGNKRVEQYYEIGVRDGKWHYYDEDGKLEKVRDWGALRR